MLKRSRGSRVASLLEKFDEQSPQRPALTGRQVPQRRHVDRHSLRDELIAQRPTALGEMDPTDASIARIGDAGDESVADHTIDGPDHGRWLDRHHSRQVGLAHAIPRPQEQEHRPLTDGHAGRSYLLRELMSDRSCDPIDEIAEAVLNHELTGRGGVA